MTYQEQQITFDKRNHQLTNINVWTPDSQWLVFDVRPNSVSFTGLTIERVNIKTQQQKQIYCAKNGAYVGVATVSSENPPRYAFIHGPEDPDKNWHYDFHHRQGVIVSDIRTNVAENIEAMCITPPFLAGALRGGTHVHVFSPDNSRLSFTYNDHVMHECDPALDLRNVAIAIPYHAINVGILGHKKHQREYSGHYYCVVISETTPKPKPGSDEISRAYEEGWIGQNGYERVNGEKQRWAIAFIGDTYSLDGKVVAEIFIVDLPESAEQYAIAGDKPIQGTETSMPAPPKGIKQRRLTYTHQRKYPGVVNQPRHWLRSTPDGSKIGFLMKDDRGIVQFWLVSPVSGAMQQITQSAWDIQSAFSWDSQGRYVAFICDNSVMLCEIPGGKLIRLTDRSDVPPSGDAVVISPDDSNIAYLRNIDGYQQIFIVATGIV